MAIKHIRRDVPVRRSPDELRDLDVLSISGFGFDVFL